jgi:ubiquinol-cytochrome c reductase cytochrome b subunit
MGRAERGPAFDSVATRLTEDQIIRQVLQGGGNMPAYGNALNPSETKALVHFLMTLRGNDLAPAVDMSRKLAETSEMQKVQSPAQSHAPEVH